MATPTSSTATAPAGSGPAGGEAELSVRSLWKVFGAKASDIPGDTSMRVFVLPQPGETGSVY